MLIDTHCHLYDEKLAGNYDEILFNAKKNGVEKIIVAGCDEQSCEKAIDLANKYEEVYACVGIYPEYAQSYNEEIEKKLEKLAKNKKVVGIGEIGLDYSVETDREKQKDVLLKQLKLACKLKLPVVLHGRDAYGDLVELLKANKDLITYGGTFHCYTGSWELAKEIVKLGFFVSVGGVSTFENAKKVREMVEMVDIKNIVLETDSPYLAPTPMRGKINKPAYVKYVAESLAKLKCMDIKEVEEQTSENAKGLFRI